MNPKPCNDGGRSLSRERAYDKKCVFLVIHRVSLITLTRSPDLGLFFGRVGKASSFGLVSMAQ